MRGSKSRERIGETEMRGRGDNFLRFSHSPIPRFVFFCILFTVYCSLFTVLIGCGKKAPPKPPAEAVSK